MSYENVKTLEDFRALDTDQQRACLDERRQQFEDIVNRRVDETFSNRDLEKSLVPALRFKAAEPKQVFIAPPVETGPDEENAARDFFRRFPSTRSIRIGDNIYERGQR